MAELLECIQLSEVYNCLLFCNSPLGKFGDLSLLFFFFFGLVFFNQSIIDLKCYINLSFILLISAVHLSDSEMAQW